MSSSSPKKKGKLIRNPFRRDKTLPAAPTPLQRADSILNTSLTSHSDISATTTTSTQASGSGSENMMKPLKKRNQSIQSDRSAASTTSGHSPTAVTRKASISTGCRTITGLAYASFCDSPFLLALCICISFFPGGARSRRSRASFRGHSPWCEPQVNNKY